MSVSFSAHRSAKLRNSVLIVGLMVLSACADGQLPAFMQPKADGGETVARASTGGFGGGAVSERDVEAPEIFQATEAGLWDGRPSLGGVWAAHPEVADPERIIIRNETNGKFVIGALFRKERQTPGPRLQISSDAAAALGILAGQPANLNVVALKREEVATQPEPDQMPAEQAVAEIAVPAAPEVNGASLDPVVSGAAAAIETASLDVPSAAPTPAPKPKPAATSSLSKPFIQIGIFSVEQNAKNTAATMRQAGMLPMVKKQSSSGKTFWRVLVGPATDKPELSTLLKKIKDTGFSDAYAVTN